jgi:putative ABC transport system substrate-binding protein
VIIRPRVKAWYDLANRTIIAVVIACIGIPPPTSVAENEVKRIGLLFQQSAPTISFAENAFWTRLHDLGWARDGNVKGFARYADGVENRLPRLMQELLDKDVDVVVAPGTQTALAATRSTRTVPIVSVMGDPIGVGLVKSLAHPNGNLTGVSLQNAEEVPSKWIELIREVMPNITVVAILVNPDNPLSVKASAQLIRSAAVFRVKVITVEARTVSEYAAAIKRTSQLAPAAVVSPDNIAMQSRRVIGEQSIKHKVLTISGQNIFVEAGGLLSYGPDDVRIWHRIADYVDKILKGARVSDLPIEQPTEFRLAVNLRTAKALGITIPESILLRVDEVIR